MLTGRILALPFRQHRHRIGFCGYLLGKAFLLSKVAQECSTFKQLLTTRGVQEFSGWFFFFSLGAGRWVSTTRHSIGKLAVKLTHLFVIWMEGPSVGGTRHLPSRGCQVSPRTPGIVVTGRGRKAVPSSLHTLHVWSAIPSFHLWMLSFLFPLSYFQQCKKNRITEQNVLRFPSLWEQWYFKHIPPSPQGSQAGIYQEKNVFQRERRFKVKLGINESDKWGTFYC